MSWKNNARELLFSLYDSESVIANFIHDLEEALDDDDEAAYERVKESVDGDEE